MAKIAKESLKNTKLLHYTEGGPWFENYKDHPYGDIWFRHLGEYLTTLEGRIMAHENADDVAREK
jgi:hypothetical protein